MKIFLAIGLAFITFTASSQCEILHRIYPDGSMIYYIEPVNFYWTKTKSLKGGVVTDKENYYLELRPLPCPEKAQGKKMKSTLELKLSNDSVYHLEHFDTRYIDHDSTIQLLYLIDKDWLEEFCQYTAISARIDMKGTEGMRNYIFKLHKDAIKEQLDCFIKEEKKPEKK
jgi:hypothetical protein